MKYWSNAWSLIEGCSPVSSACDNCWLRQMSHRFNAELTDEKGAWLKVIRYREDRLDIPLKTKKPTTFAIWSDLFHESVPADFIIEAFERMAYCPQHTFLVLTKRPERIASVLYGQEGNFYLGGGDYIQNVWLGTSVENQEMADKRIPELLKCEPFNLFLSIEPLLSPIDLKLTTEFSTKYYLIKGRPSIKQIVVGCESGHKARQTDNKWIRDIKNQCEAAGIHLFIKQIQINGKIEKDISKFPEDLRIRELIWER